MGSITFVVVTVRSNSLCTPNKTFSTIQESLCSEKCESESIFKHENHLEFGIHEGLDRRRGGLVCSNQTKFNPLFCLIKLFAISLN